jgi:hypothetical protein
MAEVHWNKHLVEGPVTYVFILHLRVCDHTTWFWRCVGTTFGHFLLGSHNFMVMALGSCVKWRWGMWVLFNFNLFLCFSKSGLDVHINKTCVALANLQWSIPGEITPSYILHTRAFGTYLLGGVIYLAKKIIRWWYFRCKKLENIIYDGILHVNMFHYFKIPYFTCNFFYKIYLQWIYWTLFFYRMLFYDFCPVISPGKHR